MALPINHRYPRVEGMADALRRVALRQAARMLGFKDPVLYIFDPHYETYVGTLSERLVCYHIYDDQEGRVTGAAARWRVREQEDRLLAKSDVILAHSKSIIEARGLQSCAEWVPNGADFELFDSYRSGGGAAPPDIARIPRPRIGYVGRINQKVDFDVLEYLARTRPDCSIVMVGPILLDGCPEEADQRRLSRLGNVFFLGAKDHRELPGYIAALDVGLLCYRLMGWIPHGYPLKLHEYFACGIPVVSADLMAVREFSHVLWMADAPAAWLRGVEAGLAEGRTRAAIRIGIARENSWEVRAQQVENAIARRLCKKRYGDQPPALVAATSSSRERKMAHIRRDATAADRISGTAALGRSSGLSSSR